MLHLNYDLTSARQELSPNVRQQGGSTAGESIMSQIYWQSKWWLHVMITIFHTSPAFGTAVNFNSFELARGIQSATEMKRCRGVPLVFAGYASCWCSCFKIYCKFPKEIVCQFPVGETCYWVQRVDNAGRQLMQLTDLYPAVDVHDHILPIAFLLIDDHVHQVRITALRVVRLRDMFCRCW